MAKADEHALQEDVEQYRYYEEVRGSLELDIEEAPLIERHWVRVEDVGGVLVHSNGALSDADDLGGGPSKNAHHRDDCEDGKCDFAGRVANSEFPEAEDDHLGEADEDLESSDVLVHQHAERAELTMRNMMPFNTVNQPLRKSWNLLPFMRPALTSASQMPLKMQTPRMTKITKMMKKM